MTDQERKAMEMALEALENVYGKGKLCDAAIKALRQALAQDHGFDRTASHMAGEYVDTNWDTSDMAHRTGGLSMEQENEACGYAKRLAQAIWEKYYKEESPDWKPKNDVLGLLTQIDNMTCGLEKAQPEQGTWTPVEIGVDVTPEGTHVVGMYVLMPEAVRHVFYSQFHTAPPSKPWVSLTDEDIKEGAKYSWVDYQAFQSVAWWADEKLKEKNT